MEHEKRAPVERRTSLWDKSPDRSPANKIVVVTELANRVLFTVYES